MAFVATLFFRISPIIFPENVFKIEIFPANLKGPAKITKELERLQSNLYAQCSGGRHGGVRVSNP